MPARRAVVRWAWRMFRREWRQQLLIVVLLAVTVAAALVWVAAGYNVDRTPQARFGTATQLISYTSDPADVSQLVEQARAWFGTIDVIGHGTASIPGLNRRADIRAQDPQGPYGGPTLRLVSGRFPAAAGELAVTDEVAALASVRIGERFALGGRDRTVVGLVENPGDLDEEFILVPPAFADPPATVTILTAASPHRFAGFTADRDLRTELRDQDRRTTTAAGVFGLTTLAMLLVGLVAVSGFIVVAQRRRRHFGLLATTGATERQVRLVLLASGAATGGVAAALGAVIAVPLWIALVPTLETAGAHRIDRWEVPWLFAGACLLLAVLTAVGAAWWPARMAARTPVTQALSMRPPRPRPAHRSAALAAVLLVAGYASLRLAHQDSVWLNILGIVAVTLGLLFLGPLAIQVAARVGVQLPVAARLSLRDLARHQARSGTALAAISLALAVPAFVVLVTAANAPPPAGNLSSRQLLIRVGDAEHPAIPDRTPAQAAALERAVREFAGTLGTPTVVGLDVAMDPDARPQPGFDGSHSGRIPVLTGVLLRDEQGEVTGLHAGGEDIPYLASPDLLRFLGIDTGAMGEDTEVLTAAPAGALVLVPDIAAAGKAEQPSPPAVTAAMPRASYAALPTVLLTPATVDRRGWEVVRGGWIIEAAQPLTTEQVAAALELAVANGLTVEVRDTHASLLQLRAGATAAGGVLALGVLAMTVGLIRGEATRDLRTLAATGASRRIRRSLAATTAGSLALLGAFLGVGVAYLAVAAIYHDDLDQLRNVPAAELAATLLGIPAAAAGAAWLLARREPRTLGRMRLD
jgi:putative ABC transport system permease protein